MKNPAGFRQTLRHARRPAHPDAVVIAINDDYADGRDVSWLWDVDFAALARRPRAGSRPRARGRRTWRVRLRYDDVDVDEVEPDLEKAVRSAVSAVEPAERVVVFSTYTAMWALHACCWPDRGPPL